jgi:hypothetical protein
VGELRKCGQNYFDIAAAFVALPLLLRSRTGNGDIDVET